MAAEEDAEQTAAAIRAFRDEVQDYSKVVADALRTMEAAGLKRMNAQRLDLAVTYGRLRPQIRAAIGQMDLGRFGDAFALLLNNSAQGFPMYHAALEGVLSGLSQAIGHYESTEGQRSQRLGALRLMPDLAAAASELFRDGHPNEAVFAASKALLSQLQRATGATAEGLPLVEQTLSPNAPKLRFNAGVTQADKDEQKGIFLLFQGVVLALRHQGAHGDRQISEEEAIESLALMNMLARRLTQAR